MKSPLKNESSQEEREITEMAKKILNQNKMKAVQQSNVPPGYYRSVGLNVPPLASNQIFGLEQNLQTMTIPLSGLDKEQKMDDTSRRGQFGWHEIDKKYFPYILRNQNKEKYVSVRMVESENQLLFSLLYRLPSELNMCHSIQSWYITDRELTLLNEINIEHTDNYYGREPFTSKDSIVSLSDVTELYSFLDFCQQKILNKGAKISNKCGFIKINQESLVPYITINKAKCIPIFYFQDEVETLNLKTITVIGWDLAYLKFCFKVHGIRRDLYDTDACQAVELEEMKSHFPQEYSFEEFWPPDGKIILAASGQTTYIGNWTKKPIVSNINESIIRNADKSSEDSAALLPKPAITSDINANNTNKLDVTPVSDKSLNNTSAEANISSLSTGYQHMQLQSSTVRTGAEHNVNSTYDSYRSPSQPDVRQHPRQNTTSVSSPLHQESYQSNMLHPHPNQTKISNLLPPSQLKEFTFDRQAQPPYKMSKPWIEQKYVHCINVQPYKFHELMTTLPEFVKHFCPQLSNEKARSLLQEGLKFPLYVGNKSHQEILFRERMSTPTQPAIMLFVKDMMKYMSQIKYVINNN